MLASFDAPDTDTGCAVRLTTTVPTQALDMLNSRFMNERADDMAAKKAGSARQSGAAHHPAALSADPLSNAPSRYMMRVFARLSLPDDVCGSAPFFARTTIASTP